LQRANSVKDALELLANKDSLEGVSDAWQQLSLEQLPVVLLLHLKCFQLDAEGHTAKIVKNIDYPIDLKVDPSKFVQLFQYKICVGNTNIFN
jgi:ubiquitin carboxyl-terminal hydrolase 10